MRVLIYFIVLFAIVSCSSTEKSDKNYNNNVIARADIIEKDETPENFTYEEIAKFAIASIMVQSPKIINVAKNGDVYNLSYVRKSDGKSFSYKVKFLGKQIVWGNLDGRWRDSTVDEKISFREKGKLVEIVQTFSDGSESIEEYSK